MKLGFLRLRVLKHFNGSFSQAKFPLGQCQGQRACFSMISFDEGKDNNGIEADFVEGKKDLEPQGVDPIKGWNFRGVHKAIICGKIGQAPIQKILRNGKIATIFTVGTGGMYDQRISGNEHLPRPTQWHRIAVHNENLGAFSIQQLAKNSSVLVEGDIETRVYNDSITGQVKNIPEICVRHDGKIRLIKSGDATASISLEGLILIRRDKIEYKITKTTRQMLRFQWELMQLRRLVSLNGAVLGLPGICRSQISSSKNRSAHSLLFQWRDLYPKPSLFFICLLCSYCVAGPREEIMQRERTIPVAGKHSPSSSHGDSKSKNLSSPLFLFPDLNPTSNLEPKRSPFSKRPPKAPLLELQSEPIGLAILDALVDDKENGKMVLFGSQLRVRIPSMESPRSPIEFGVKNKESQLALVSPGRPLSLAVLDAVSASATELETLENYTCVISRGSNPKTTHIFDDCVLESCGDWRASIYSTQEEQP